MATRTTIHTFFASASRTSFHRHLPSSHFFSPLIASSRSSGKYTLLKGGCVSSPHLPTHSVLVSRFSCRGRVSASPTNVFAAFEDELYQTAKLLFTSISNWARLATTLIYLGENRSAVESARKAGNSTQYVVFLFPFEQLLTTPLKQVHAACIYY